MNNKRPFKKPHAVSSSKDNFFVQAKMRQDRSEKLSKSQVNKKTSDAQQQKKPFDKKQWRLQKYSNKYKVEEWENKRKKIMTRRYNKVLKKQPSFDVQKIYEEAERDAQTIEKFEGQDSVETSENSNKKKGRGRNYAEKIESWKEDKEKKREEAEKRKAEKMAALEAYRQKKVQKNRILTKKTSKGQPIMKGRLELLLQQIQESCAK